MEDGYLGLSGFVLWKDVQKDTLCYFSVKFQLLQLLRLSRAANRLLSAN